MLSSVYFCVIYFYSSSHPPSRERKVAHCSEFLSGLVDMVEIYGLFLFLSRGKFVGGGGSYSGVIWRWSLVSLFGLRVGRGGS